MYQISVKSSNRWHSASLGRCQCDSVHHLRFDRKWIDVRPRRSRYMYILTFEAHIAPASQNSTLFWQCTTELLII